MRSLIGFLVVVGVQCVAIGAGHVSDEASPDDSTGIWAVISLLERIEKKMENMETRMNHRQDDANKRLENGIINLKKKVDSIHTLMQNYIKGLTTAKPMTTKKGPHTGQRFILLTTGAKKESAQYPEKIYKESTIISTAGRKCKSFPSFPMPLFAATGGIVKGAPIVCGGVLVPKEEFSNQCFIHDFSRNEWRFLSNMAGRRGRAFTSSVVPDDALWITGQRKTTEFIYPSGKVVQGPNLPSEVSGHCMVKLHDGKIMILGGDKYHDDDTQVLIYDPKSNYSLSKGPPLLYGILAAACTVFNSPVHNGRPVILVTGGFTTYNTSQPVFASQIFDYTHRDSWEIAPSLPKITSKDAFYSGGTLLPTSTGAIGFFENVALRFDCSATKCEWKEMDVEMDYIPSFAVAMYLPEKYAQRYGC